MDTYKIAIVKGDVRDAALIAHYDRVMLNTHSNNLKGMENLNGTLELHLYGGADVNAELLENLCHRALRVVVLDVTAIEIYQ